MQNKAKYIKVNNRYDHFLQNSSFITVFDTMSKEQGRKCAFDHNGFILKALENFSKIFSTKYS